MAESSIVCFDEIIFRENCLISWDNFIMYNDFHKIYKNDKVINENKRVIIGNDVWIGCRSTILKGSEIASNSVIAAASIVTKKFNKKK